jgi:small subunit ribosomal protein S9
MSPKKKEEVYLATGRRKTSSARVRIQTGSGQFLINGREVNDYCSTEQHRRTVKSPLEEVDMTETVDVTASVAGGGSSGQAGAVRHGIARALEKMDPELRKVLKKAGHLRRDPRKKERKKTGQPGARKRFQFSKR